MTNALLADIGGTNARFAFLGSDGIAGAIIRLQTNAYASVEQALADVLHDREKPDRLIIAAAGPVEHGVCTLTNAGWRIDAAAIAREFSLPSVQLLNDLEAVGHALPYLGPCESQRIGGPESAVGPRLVIGIGTGIGTALWTGPAAVIACEGGQTNWASNLPEEAAALQHLADQQGYLPVEKVLAASAISTLYNAFNPGLDPISPEAVIARRDTDRAAADTLHLFTRMLGRYAGDAALQTGAKGGVFLVSNMLNHWGQALDRAALQRSFTGKGKFQGYLDGIPLRLVTTPDPAFTGLAALARTGER